MQEGVKDCEIEGKWKINSILIIKPSYTESKISI
jgi:hypothetical protein